MMWAGNVARRRGRRVHTELWRGLLKERDQLEDIGLEERIILRLIFNPWATNVIYIYIEHPCLMFLDHTQRRSTVGRTPLDE